MSASDLDTDHLKTLLGAVGAHLEAGGVSASVVIVGGAALCLRGLVRRTTQDVDVLAVVAPDPSGPWSPPVFSPALSDAIARVARDYDLEPGWFNAAIGAQWTTGLPEGVESGVDWLQFRGLWVGLAGRQALIALKLIASVDQWPASVHLQDLSALEPTDDELERARCWVVTQDGAPGFPAAVTEVIDHVRDHR